MPLTTWLVLLGILLFLWFWIFGHQGLYELDRLRGVKQELLEENEKRLQEKKELESQLRYLKDPNYQKHLIHKELGYVEKGEAMIQFPAKE